MGISRFNGGKGTRNSELFHLCGCEKSPKKGGKKSPDWGNFICSTQGFQPPPKSDFSCPFPSSPGSLFPSFPQTQLSLPFPHAGNWILGWKTRGLNLSRCFFSSFSFFFFPLPGFFKESEPPAPFPVYGGHFWWSNSSAGAPQLPLPCRKRPNPRLKPGFKTPNPALKPPTHTQARV